MTPIKATELTGLIEAMILASIAAALTGKIKDADYECGMQDKKTKIAEILETT